MADKKHDLREIRSLDLQKEMYRENEFPFEGTHPDCPPDREEDDILNEWYRNKDRVVEEQGKMVSGIKASALAPRFVDSRAVCRIFSDNDDNPDSFGNFFSFRFDAGAGFFMDFSILEDGWEFPLECRFEKLPWEDGRIERILSAFNRIRTGMKDGMIIDFENSYKWSGFAVDLFPHTFFDRQHYYRHDKRFVERYFPSLLETPSDEYYFTSFMYFYWNKWPGFSSEDREVGDFGIARAGYPYAKEYHAVQYHLIRVLFPWEPTPEDLAWVASIKPELEAMWEAVTEEEEYGDGDGGLHTRRCFLTGYRFVIFPDKGD